MDSGDFKEASIRWGPDPQCEGAIIGGKDMLGQWAWPMTLCHELCKRA